MGRFVARRALMAIPTIIGATLLVFMVMYIIPGDVAKMILLGREGEGVANPITVAAIQRELGLDRPLYAQYLGWLGAIFRGDFGKSLFTADPIGPEFLRRLPMTVELALLSSMIGVGLGIPIGVLSALKQDRWPDYTLRVWAIVFLAIPNFWLGILVIILGLRWFGWIPPIGYNYLWEDPLANLLQLIWPAMILGSAEMAAIARMSRTTMLEVLRQDYIRTARAKGLAEPRVMVRHALKNAMIPVVTQASLRLASLMAGTVILETIFNIPGLGFWFIQAARDRDYMVVQNLVMFFAVIYVTINFAVDIAYGWLDPRIRYG